MADEDEVAARVQQFEQFLDNFAVYTSRQSEIDLEDAKATRNARLQDVELGLPADDFTRFRLFSHLHDHLMASLLLELPQQQQHLAPLYPSTIVRRFTQATIQHITSQPSRPFPGFPFGQLERTLRRQYLPSLEKLDWHMGEYIELPYQRQLRYIKAHHAELLWLFFSLDHLNRVYGLRLRHLDSMMVLQYRDQTAQVDAENYVAIAEAVHIVLFDYSHQLKRLWLNFDGFWLEEDEDLPPFPVMTRLVFLQVNVHNEASYRLVVERLLWDYNRISELHLRLAYPMLGRLFSILDQVPALVKLAVEYIREPGYSCADLLALQNILRALWNPMEWELMNILKPGQQQVKLKVLCLYAPQTDLFLNYLCQFFGSTIVKICIFIAETMTFDLEDFTALSILQLDFCFMPYFEPFFSRDHISSTRLTTLTLTNLNPVTSHILDIFGRTFPNLREVNVGGLNQESYQHDQLTDGLLVASLQNHLPKVMIFRFTDNYIKCGNGNLSRSIELMLNRADQTGRRVIFQVPADENVRQQMPTELKKQVLLSKSFRLI